MDTSRNQDDDLTTKDRLIIDSVRVSTHMQDYPNVISARGPEFDASIVYETPDREAFQFQYVEQILRAQRNKEAVTVFSVTSLADWRGPNMLASVMRTLEKMPRAERPYYLFSCIIPNSKSRSKCHNYLRDFHTEKALSRVDLKMKSSGDSNYSGVLMKTIQNLIKAGKELSEIMNDRKMRAPYVQNCFCPFCGKTALQNVPLIDHLMTVHYRGWFLCGICIRKRVTDSSWGLPYYSKYGGLQSHCKTVHDKETSSEELELFTSSGRDSEFTDEDLEAEEGSQPPSKRARTGAK